MGQGQSLQPYNSSHVRIYRDLLRIQNPVTRAEMIRTLLAGQEYVATAKAAGVYAHLLSYISRVQAGERPSAPLPGESAMNTVVIGGTGGGTGGGLTASQAPQVSRTSSYVAPQQLVSYDPSAGGLRPQVQQRPSQVVAKGRRNEKALNYFQSCLQVLGLEEEVALTDEALKKAYKKAAVRAHPDKGGSEEEFEAVTRAHAYLGEILRRVRGGREKEGKVEAPEALRDQRTKDSKAWELAEPVRLNPKKLDLDAFNKMFEQTRIPDPEDEGYGDWLKSTEGEGAAAAAAKFSGKFNRDVFNRMFEEEARAKGRANGGAGQELALRQPEALTLAPTSGVLLGRGAGGDFTAAANASMKFTDLRNAFTRENMITTQVADVQVEQRSFDRYSQQYKAAPAPLADHEMAAIAAAEKAAAQRERQRQLRAAEEDTVASQYFERMKRLVITNGS